MTAPKSVIVIHRRRDGSTSFDAPVPAEHTLSARFINRELGSGLVSVAVTISPSGGPPAVYDLEGFEELPDGTPNWTGWRLHLREADEDG